MFRTPAPVAITYCSEPALSVPSVVCVGERWSMSEELVISVLMSILWPFTQNKIPVVCGSLRTVPVLCLHLT